jgi:hypothetical protein
MPALRQPRREAFVRNIIASVKTGKSQAQCYEDAGYTTSGNASEAAASRLLSDVKVKERIDELARPAVRKVAFTLETLSAEVAQTIRDARAAGQHGVVTRALELAAKLHGLLTTKIDVEHSFADRAEAFQAISARHGEEVAGILREALERGADAVIEERRALRARDVTPSAGRSEADAIIEEMPRRD